MFVINFYLTIELFYSCFPKPGRESRATRPKQARQGNPSLIQPANLFSGRFGRPNEVHESLFQLNFCVSNMSRWYIRCVLPFFGDRSTRLCVSVRNFACQIDNASPIEQTLIYLQGKGERGRR